MTWCFFIIFFSYIKIIYFYTYYCNVIVSVYLLVLSFVIFVWNLGDIRDIREKRMKSEWFFSKEEIEFSFGFFALIFCDSITFFFTWNFFFIWFSIFNFHDFFFYLLASTMQYSAICLEAHFQISEYLKQSIATHIIQKINKRQILTTTKKKYNECCFLLQECLTFDKALNDFKQ